MTSSANEAEFSIRRADPTDHPRIMSVMIDWWAGRDLRRSVPKLFLDHFCNTSFVAERDHDMAAFLVGFLSPAHDNEGYIHFVGVRPDCRVQGLARAMYEGFFELCRQRKRTIVRACTSPVNKGSIAFHTSMGFLVEPGDGMVDGVPVTVDYNHAGDHKVLFLKHL